MSGANGIELLLLWATIILAVVVTYIRANPGHWSFRDFMRHFLPPEVFHHPSARADFLFWLSRRIFIPLLVVPLVISTAVAGHFAYWVLSSILGPPSHPVSPAGPGCCSPSRVTMLLAYDLSYYLYHRMQHKIPILWELHKVHHSAQVMIGVTRERVHPLDEIMNRWWDGVIPGLCYGIWLFFALDPVELTVFGINIYALRNIILMMDFVRHTHWKLSYGRHLDAVLLSPHYHQLHHSVAEKHWDRTVPRDGQCRGGSGDRSGPPRPPGGRPGRQWSPRRLPPCCVKKWSAIGELEEQCRASEHGRGETREDKAFDHRQERVAHKASKRFHGVSLLVYEVANRQWSHILYQCSSGCFDRRRSPPCLPAR